MQSGGGNHIRADLRACPLCVCSPTLLLNRNLCELTSFKFVPCWLARGPMKIGRVVATPGPPPCPAAAALGVRGVVLVVAAASSLAAVCRVCLGRDAARRVYVRARCERAIF